MPMASKALLLLSQFIVNGHLTLWTLNSFVAFSWVATMALSVSCPFPVPVCTDGQRLCRLLLDALDQQPDLLVWSVPAVDGHLDTVDSC
jgi:hypothetical protein